jgi:hypothetical protein
MRYILQNVFILVYFLFITASPGWPSPRLSFKDMIHDADVIVEGFVLEQADSANKLYQENVGSQGVTVVLSMGPVKQAKFYVSKVYKGELKVNQLIDIYTDSRESKVPGELKIKSEYLMFLNQKWDKIGFKIVYKDKGYWQIFDCEGQKRLKAWNQDSRLRNPDSYQSYADFVKELEGSLSRIAFGEE